MKLKKLINKIKNFLYIIAIPVFIYIQINFLGSFLLSIEIISNIIIFLSIIFGFYITSLAIFATSNYMYDLYKIADANNKNLTLLHTLINKYKTGLKIILFSIVLLSESLKNNA